MALQAFKMIFYAALATQSSSVYFVLFLIYNKKKKNEQLREWHLRGELAL